ncbi:MAG: hypothetical protein AVDCRST_MAG56-8142 [uncultured Cytophagales bacterium]|uniref:Uncharacterized protein n=1 Tax=uncultured Cytophagales bacterium TaxID=158755 RepID=A0A6J4M1D3_9SPHI|nr:MAG: hypothetical protein AVDCRST_MAG56-8142 [uncultured Cytophagales bacterium]
MARAEWIADVNALVMSFVPFFLPPGCNSTVRDFSSRAVRIGEGCRNTGTWNRVLWEQTAKV